VVLRRALTALERPVLMRAQRPRLHVPRAGLSEKSLRDTLRISWTQLRDLYGDVIGAPRDYRPGPLGPVFNAGGVRRLVTHLGIDVDVVEEEQLVGPVLDRQRRYWWQEVDA
jgi:hypothetical protein